MAEHGCSELEGCTHSVPTEQGLAYVDFEDEESLAAAIAKNKEELKGRQLSIARSDPKGGRGGGRGPGANRGGRTGASGRGESFSNHYTILRPSFSIC